MRSACPTWRAYSSIAMSSRRRLGARPSRAARALVALELIHNNPGITAQRLADRLGVTERAARRYVATLREADLPIESVSGPYGGYRVGRGLRLPPLMFTAAEALGLVMAVLEGHPKAADPADPSAPPWPRSSGCCPSESRARPAACAMSPARARPISTGQARS